jgi:hypothetical protein
VAFEPTISAGERPQPYALDRVATGTSHYYHYYYYYYYYYYLLVVVAVVLSSSSLLSNFSLLSLSLETFTYPEMCNVM